MRQKFKPTTAAALMRMEQVEASGETFALQYGDTYFTPIQAAYILGCSERTLSNITGQGRIGFDDFGKVIRYRKAHLEAFIGVSEPSGVAL